MPEGKLIENQYSTHVMLCAQMTSTDEDLLSLDYYVRKTFQKTASLMANSSKAVAILGGQPKDVSELAWQYGRHLGLAFQVCTCMHSGLVLFLYLCELACSGACRSLHTSRWPVCCTHRWML